MCTGCCEMSIVVPLYNKEDYIGDTLTSIICQDFDDWEAIIVDDGSTDDGLAVVQSYASKDSRIVSISQDNSGVSAARNAGIKMARGRIICFLDADDQWTPSHLSEILRLSKTYPLADVFFDQMVVKKNDRLKRSSWWEKNSSEGYLPSYCEALSKCPNLINSSNVAVRSSLFKSVYPWFIEGDVIGEDLELWLRLSMQCRIAYSATMGAIYNRDVAVNARTSNSVHYPRGYFKMIDKALSAQYLSEAERLSLLGVKDRKTVALVFSLISSDRRVEARQVLANWSPQSSYARYKPILCMASYAPRFTIDAVNYIRARLS